MSKFRMKPLVLAMTAAGICASPSFAQTDSNSVVEEELVVTGFRKAIQNSLSLKQNETSIVEAVSAEDIGKLPDSSIAESLARLPGLAGERRDGRTSGLTVRGFNENYVGTTLNGRELLGMGDNRGVEYDLYPSEIISAAIVYKTPEASLITQGVGGTVDLQTLRPLDADSILAINANYEKNGLSSANPDFDDTGHRLAFTYSDKYADDTVGFAVTIASMESPSQEEQFAAWGYNNGTISGHDSYVRSAVMERDTISSILQFEPNERLNITLDALYIDFSESDVRRGIEELMSLSDTVFEDGRTVSGNYGGFHSVVRNDGQREEAELTTFGLNVDYQLNDAWSLNFDASFGESEKEIVSIESYSGVGRATVEYVLDGNGDIALDGDGNAITQIVDRPASSGSFEMTSRGISFTPDQNSPDLTDPSLIRLAGPQSWGGALQPVDQFAATFVNPNGNPPDLNDQLNNQFTAQDGFVNSPFFEEELTGLRLTTTGEVEMGFVKGLEFGVNYSDRSKTKDNDGFYLTAPTWPGDAPIPDDVVVGAISLSHLGDRAILGYDGLGLYDRGFYIRTAAADLETSRLGDSYTVDEKLLNAYAQANIDTEIGNVIVTGNFGIQVVQADQKASGFRAIIDETASVNATPISDGDKYTDVLPSLNLSFEVADGHFVRTALAKTSSRPRMDDMSPNEQIGFSFNDASIAQTDPSQSAFSGSTGNSRLKPLEVNQFDLAYDWYFSDEGAFSYAFFYKDIQNWTVNQSEVRDFSEFYIPSYHQSSTGAAPATFLGTWSFNADGLKGFARGHEFQLTLPFNMFAEALDGFGVTTSATFSKGQFDDGSDIPGLSEEIYQLTGYYQKGGFEFRISGRKRDDYLSEGRGISLSLTQTVDSGADLWDAQMGYDFSESGIDALDGLRVTLQAQNLTDEDTVTVDQNDPRLITRYSSFGANYLLGVNYSF